MKLSTSFAMICIVAFFIFSVLPAAGQFPVNPILFVTQVPTPSDSFAVASVFCNHLGATSSAPRGGDLMIRYPDGSVKNLTQEAGYGSSGMQGALSIAVREPSMHWNGTKAVFSMVQGAPSSQNDNTQYFWQLYEITGLGKNETPVITKVPNQPTTYNNVSPIYGTDDRIIFTSDRPRNGASHLYPQLDEYKLEPTTSGLWSLEPGTGDLFMMDHNPSGDFSPFLDSYGRVLTIRWDHLQRDGIADRDYNGTGNAGTFNYTDESITAQEQYGVRTEIFPEPQGSRPDLLAGTNMVGMEFNIFLPWQLNEDGTQLESINHIGRHELRYAIGRNINDDPNVVNMLFSTSGRTNQNILQNLMQIREDPTSPGKYFFVDCQQNNMHGAGQICTLQGQPTLDPDKMTVTYITDRATSSYTFAGNTPSSNHTGMYRNPLPTTDAKLVCSHSPYTFPDNNMGTPSNPLSHYDFRLKTLKKQGTYWVPDQLMTGGITKNVTQWTSTGQISYNGVLWEMYPVEVVARTKPTRRTSGLPGIEKSVFTEENVDEAKFRSYLKKNNLALIISRDITNRDKADKQQPYYLKIAGTAKQTPNASGKVYDVAHFNIYQGDLIRGVGKFSASTPAGPGRRVIAQHLHDATNPPNPTGVPGSTKLGTDGSMASFVPTARALTWSLADPNGKDIVRERYWVTFPAGEIRVCASCHGTNDAAVNPLNATPQNKPEALRTLLQYWKSQVIPGAPMHILPKDSATAQGVSGELQWNSVASATGYHAQISDKSDFSSIIGDYTNLTSTTLKYSGLKDGVLYYWRVAASNEYGDGTYSKPWQFTTAGIVALPQTPIQTLPLNNATKVPLDIALQWTTVTGATYNLQVSPLPDCSSPVMDLTGLTAATKFTQGLSNSTTYYWRVQSVNTAGASSWSPIWQFTTLSAVIPLLAPSLSAPADGVKNQPRNLTLTWQTLANATGYEVEIATDSAFLTGIISKKTSDPTLPLTSLTNNTLYYWHVRGTAAGQNGPWSDKRSFLVVIANPVLSMPADLATKIDTAGELRWLEVSGASSYRIQISTSTDFTSPLVNVNNGAPVTTYSYTGLAPNSKYYWQIRASSALGNGPSNFSPVWSFTTKSTQVNGIDEVPGTNRMTLFITPNPSVSSMSTVHYTLSRDANTSIRIIDMLGRCISSTGSEHQLAGEHSVSLNALLPAGSEIGCGVYFVQLLSGGSMIVQNIVIVP
ncbi:MAG: T9SS type A sorting domain-containing protein [Candidatus Kapaibacterium sp.]